MSTCRAVDVVDVLDVVVVAVDESAGVVAEMVRRFARARMR